MATLSQRAFTTELLKERPASLGSGKYYLDKEFKLTNNTGETNMTLRTINLTLVDNNSNLKGKDKIVYQALNLVTEHNDDRTIQQVLVSGDVATALFEHNAKRVKTLDRDILRTTGRDVFLEEIEIFDLKWQSVTVG